MTDIPSHTCWIVTEGMAGTENQCVGIAEALALHTSVTTEVKRVTLKQPWTNLSPWLGFENAGIFSPALEPPWPDILITSGRKAIAVSRYVKKASGGQTFTVHIQDPRISPKHFDLVALAKHDPTRGQNVVTTLAAPNRITAQKLEQARMQFSDFENIKAPRVAVLIGGNSKTHRMTLEIMRKLAQQLAALDAGLLVTTSRRTGAENEQILRDTLHGRPDAYVWDGGGENPYFGILAWADYILVTADSTSMLSDAASTGKPVYVVPLEGGGRRLDRMVANLQEAGIIRPFEGRLERWNYPPLKDAELIAQAILARLKG